jgi:hypothetical protein
MYGYCLGMMAIWALVAVNQQAVFFAAPDKEAASST